MFVIFLRYFRDRRNSLIVFTLAGVLLIWLYIAFYPIIEQQNANIMAFMESVPKSLLKVFGVEDFDFFTVEGFLTFKHYNVTWPVMMIFLMASLAGTSISGAIEQETMELPLACPISRFKFFFGIYITGVITLVVFTICTILIVVPLLEIDGTDYVFKFHFFVTIHSLFFGWAVFSLAMMLSSFFSEPRAVYMVLGGIIFTMYILFILPGFISSLRWVQYLSLFYYFDPKYILLSNTVNSTSLLVFAMTSIFSTLIGLVWFKRRDIAV
jgi:beta-exotoxin I transport system permease protein